MPGTQARTQEHSATPANSNSGSEARSGRGRRPATDDEILGIAPDQTQASTDPGTPLEATATGQKKESVADTGRTTPPNAAEPEELRSAFEAHPDLEAAWRDVQEYRETFATPEEARAATALLADMDRMDALFFSSRAEDHAALAQKIAELDPAAFASLAQVMNEMVSEVQSRGQTHRERANAPRTVRDEPNVSSNAKTEPDGHGPHTEGASVRQEEFFQATNAAAVQSVLDAVESQVGRLLPEGTSKSARNRVVGEIYRELDNALRSNRQLAQQVREAFRSGALDADHQRAIVSLISGRARQALPGVAKRVLSEWTSTVMSAHQDRRARQRTAERRVDIAGSNGAGNEGRRTTSPRDIDYARMSDADILNL